MPKLWSETIEAHRREVREAILEATAELAADQGLLSVTMSQVAEATGIGRATLYKYFPDVGSILLAWHEREIGNHLDRLVRARDRAGSDTMARLRAVLEAYALIDHEAHGSKPHPGHLHEQMLSSLLHRGAHVVRAKERLTAMVRDLIRDAAVAGTIRDDVAPGELARYCIAALGGSKDSPTKRAVITSVDLTLDALQGQ